MIKKDKLLFVTCLIFITSLQVSQESAIKFGEESENDAALKNPSVPFKQDEKFDPKVNNPPSSDKEETNSKDGADTRFFFGGKPYYGGYHRPYYGYRPKYPYYSHGQYYGGSNSYYGGSYFTSGGGYPYYSYYK